MLLLSCAIVQHEVSQEYARPWQTWPNENTESVQVNTRNSPLPMNRKTSAINLPLTIHGCFPRNWVAQLYGTRCVRSTCDKRARKKTLNQCRWTPETCRCRWTGRQIRYKLTFLLSCAIVQHEVCQEYVRQTWPKENTESVQVNARNLPLPLNRKTDPL